jgi:hypothetical protein
MLSQNSTALSTKILAELAGEILYFPFWWYSAGLLKIVKFLNNFIRDREKSLGFLVWAKNIFRPMYGQYDWQGRLISFFIRLIQIIFRGVIMLFWLLVALAIFLFWVILPFLVLYQIYFQLI